MSHTGDILKELNKKLKSAETAAEVEDLRVEYLGRKGVVTTELRGISELPEQERARAGQQLNKLKMDLQIALDKRLDDLQAKQLESESSEFIDMTRPGVGPAIGRLHPVESLQHEMVELFWQLGFQAVTGPEIETDWYCFEALNIGPHHPARDMQDTFYLENGSIPRTHTSSVQIRHMETHKPPIRIIAPGKVYRNEDEDATHIWSFRQLEGLVVDRGISMGDLKGTLEYMLKGIFGEDTELRLRPNYFPYTEPSVEMDASCQNCNEASQAGCRVCKGTGWVELGGAGMVHAQVFRNVGIDPEIYTGFAFGFGLERIAAIKYQLPDLRDLWRPNLKFLEQF
ncbi:MAG: phenylalanine--tRNA ligase subunit alpha [Candidatus Saccharimonadales bacterium]